MNSNDLSSLFLFSDYVGKSTLPVLDSETKHAIDNMYEVRIKEFLNTWFIFGYRNECCQNYVSKEDIYLTKNNYNVVEHSFYQIFGDKYTNNTLSYIVTRLNRFRHIFKCEKNPQFESAFEDCNMSGNIYKKVLSKKDPQYLLSKYKSIYKFYLTIHLNTNEDLMKMFDNIISDISQSYIENNSFENKILPFIEESIFYNNSLYDELREKLLVISYELICRFYESIDIDVYSNIGPTSQYVNGFYKIQKAVISNDILYIFLRDSKNVLVYDFEDKLAFESNTCESQKYTYIDKTRHIYLLSFETNITNMIYNQTNMMIFLSNGKILINGKNNNHQINDSSKETYSKFVSFNFYDISRISNVKIYKNHIYIIDKSNNIYIYGDVKNGNAFVDFNLIQVGKSIYKDQDHTNYNNFTLSEDETKLIFTNEIDNTAYKTFAFNSFSVKISEDDIGAIFTNLLTNETLDYDFSHSNFKISNVIRLNGDSFIFEFQNKEKLNEFSYSIFGLDENKSYKFGYEEEETNIWDALHFEHSMDEIIQTNSNGEVDKTIRIKHIESFDDKTIIMMSNGYIYASGKNDGYFITKNNYSEIEVKYDDLETFERIDNKWDGSTFNSFVVTRNTDKSLVFAYNENNGVGFGSYYFLGMKNGSGYRFNNTEVKEKFEDNSLNGKTHKHFYSYFCTNNCIYYTTPFYDLISHFFLTNIEYSNSSIDHVIKSLLYLKDMSVNYNEEAYDHMVNNLTILSNGSEQPSFLTSNQTIVLFSNLQNFTMHDSMLLIYSKDEEKYNCVSKFINMIGLMSENFSAMKIKKTKIGQMDYDLFIKSLNDINVKSSIDLEEKINGIRNNKYRA